MCETELVPSVDRVVVSLTTPTPKNQVAFGGFGANTANPTQKSKRFKAETVYMYV